MEPRQYEGRLLHQLPRTRTAFGDIYAELYINEPSDGNRVALFRRGTRVVEDVVQIDDFARPPWTLRYLQGHVDAGFVELTPGTRTGVIRDTAYAALRDGMRALEGRLIDIIEEQRRAEEERASRDQLKVIQRVFREALLALPEEEYDWFDIRTKAFRTEPSVHLAEEPAAVEAVDASGGAPEPILDGAAQRDFFDFPGPLFSVVVSPASSIVRVGEHRQLRALPRDRSRRRVERALEFEWRIHEGSGTLVGTANQAVVYHAPAEPGMVRIEVVVRQQDVACAGEALITVTKELVAQLGPSSAPAQGLPGYTFERAPGQSWRSRFDAERNLIVVNNGHRDFVFASRGKALKLRYLIRLYAKELILRNFMGISGDQLLERMIELSLRAEESL